MNVKHLNMIQFFVIRNNSSLWLIRNKKLNWLKYIYYKFATEITILTMLFVSRNEPKKCRGGSFANTKAVSKRRPFSYSHSRINKNGEQTEFASTNKEINCAFITQKSNTHVLTTFEGAKKRNPTIKSTHKEVEDLLEENIGLKKENHKLQGQLLQLKGRIELKNRKTAEKGKQLGMEFEKELYWAGSKTHMISGIKYQYQKLKMKYEEQIKQIENLKRKIRQTKILQFQVQVESLEAENKRLAEIIRRIQQKTPNVVLNVRKYSPKKTEQSNQEKYLKCVQQLEKMAKSGEHAKQIIKERQSKILFLQKLLIQKDNRDYHSSRKVKKTQRMIDQLKEANIKLTEEMNNSKKLHEYQKNELQKKFEEEKEEIRNSMGKQIADLNNKVESLLDDKKQLENNVTKLKKAVSITSRQRRNTLTSNNNANSLNNSANRSVAFQQQVSDVIPVTLITSKEEATAKTENVHQQNEEKDQQKLKKEKNKNRVMQSSAQKYSDEAKKLRKVHYLQIVEITELIKYRMIAKGISSDAIKKYFEHEKNEQKNLVIMEGEESYEEEPQWQDEYITMKEVKTILKDEPFCLDENSAHLFARYAIEDCQQQHVYCDQNNENKRQIVKSIIKAAVGNYEFPTQKQFLQLNDFKSKYLPNILAALKIYYPTGKVTKAKFVEVLTSLQLQMSQIFEDLILSKIAAQSRSMHELQYQFLSQI